MFNSPPRATPTIVPQPEIVAATTHGDIAQRAYDIYIQSGSLPGRCQKNWLQAEKDLRKQGAASWQSQHRTKEVFTPDAP